MSLKSGHSVVLVTGEEAEKQKKFEGYKDGTVRLQPDGWFFSSYFPEYADRYYDFQFKPSDIVIMTYPKSGTTWTHEIIWTLLKNPDLDNPEANLPIFVRAPLLEFDFLMKPIGNEPGDPHYDVFVKSYPDRDPGDSMFLQFTELTDEPRVIKTHLPFSLLSPKLIDTCKVIYVARDPKDVSVSFFHHCRLIKIEDYTGTDDEFYQHFINDTMIYSPFWKHLKEGWEKRDHPNLHYCFYEDLKADPKGEIIKFQKFLGIDRTEKQIDNVVEYTSFSAMKGRDPLSPTKSLQHSSGENKILNLEVVEEGGTFYRKGIAGDWKNELSAQQAEQIQKWTEENTKDFGPDFKYRN